MGFAETAHRGGMMHFTVATRRPAWIGAERAGFRHAKLYHSNTRGTIGKTPKTPIETRL
jgi:hypothetical protein